jgi:glycosyltransferase involved in cell wall biosynthesis
MNMNMPVFPSQVDTDTFQDSTSTFTKENWSKVEQSIPKQRKPSQGNSVKVAYMMSRFPKISETFILYEMLEQERQGISVELYPLLRENQAVAHPEAEKMMTRAHFHPFLSWPIVKANWHYLRHRPSAYFKMMAEVLGGTFGSANFFVGAIGILPKSVRFAYEMEKQGITHVHAHFATHPAVAGLIIQRLTGIPFSFVAHGSDLHVRRRMLDKKVEAAAFVVAISSYNKEIIVEECKGRFRDKVHVIHCGIDPDVFMPRDEKDAGGPFRILCVASFEEVKGHKYLVEACRLLHERGVNFICHLVGDGPVRSQVEAQITRANLEDRIIVHGPLKRPQVVELMQRADVKALPSVPTKSGKREGIPVVLMEAMASGLPVVSSQLSGIPELVEDGRSGFLLPPRDATGLAEALQKLHDDPELRFNMGRTGREKVLREFNLRVNAAELAKLFQKNGK